LPREWERLEKALVQTRHQILDVQRKVGQAMGAEDAGIFDAHLLVLEDRTLIDEVTRLMEREMVNVDYAFQQVAERYATTLEAIDDEYLRERASDMRDVTARVLNNLMNRSHEVDLHHLQEPCILVSSDLSPSITATLDRDKVLGLRPTSAARRPTQRSWRVRFRFPRWSDCTTPPATWRPATTCC